VVLKGEMIQRRFDEFQRRKRESILAYKDKIHIVVYGAYNPPSDGKHLEERTAVKLRDCLKADGYIFERRTIGTKICCYPCRKGR
jgi:hypothetical protein